ncbi:MAG: phosphoribosylglycinamide formyltransferase 2 [Candidatus Nezhaarchaeota archaeon]|nr:phosphoribosylglycinamide formyltransferase 2 [Candidatus Nezhaarchaeota archaeon]MCX8141426.1 phosphoribosylglycinamide formyltransferase 2 [Candidatus Nezhaarchaeota archaeon]MDW8049692.1 phosphoribosylglycinamide formyltransferase 2 [Nitrososphaerota archaeon]
MQLRNEIGTPLLEGATRILLLGAGELGKEIAIEAQRLGVEVVTVDRYDMPPASHVAHRHYTVNMLDGRALKTIIRREKPDAVIPEIEAIDTDALIELEEEGFFIVPNAKAVKITMDRTLLRKLAAEEAGVPTSRYMFAENLEELKDCCERIGYPCLVKAQMSSGGLGSTIVTGRDMVKVAYERALREARGLSRRLIVEQLIDFDVEVTVLTLAHVGVDGKLCVTPLEPIGHVRSTGHYHVSWQPLFDIDPSTGYTKSSFEGYGGPMHLMEDPPQDKLRWRSHWNGKRIDEGMARTVKSILHDIAKRVVTKLLETKEGLRGLGIFGCEIFVKLGDEGAKPQAFFNEVSPRPHDTGMVTLVTQDQSEMALHVRAVLGLPIPEVKVLTCGASHVVLAKVGGSWAPRYGGVGEALKIPGVQLRLFGKPVTYVDRRMGVTLAIADSVNEARSKAMRAAHIVEGMIVYG